MSRTFKPSSVLKSKMSINRNYLFYMVREFNFICIIFSYQLIHPAKSASSSMNSNCIFSYTYDGSQIQTTQGFQFTIQGSNSVCCKKMMTDKSSLDIMKRDVNCCLLEGNACYLDGMRPCSNKICIGNFPSSSQPETVQNDAQDKQVVQTLCPSVVKPNKQGELLKYNAESSLIGMTDKSDKCIDSSMSTRIIFAYVNTNTNKMVASPSFSWCCSNDIFSDYSTDPKKVCCGLSGSSAPNYYPGAGVNIENPPCCRKIGNRALCEPYVSNSKKKFNQACPPLSGKYDKTTDLKETLPYFSPMYYAFNSMKPTYTTSKCKIIFSPPSVGNVEAIGSPSFYSIKNAKDTQAQQFGLCCIGKDTFFMDQSIILKFCCISYVKLSGSKATSPEKVSLPCDDNGKIQENTFHFQPCPDKSGKKKLKCTNSMLVYDESAVNEISIQNAKETNLYDSYKFFKPRYSKNP